MQVIIDTKEGFIVNFIPSPVTKAFTTGTSLIVALVQLKNLLGIKVKGIPYTFWKYLDKYDTGIGVICLMTLLALKQLSSINFKSQTEKSKRIKKLLWYISISRNAIVVFTCGLITFLWVRKSSLQAVPYSLSSKVVSGLPRLSLPPFVFEYENKTYVFTDILRELSSGILVVPIVAVLANVAIAKAFVKDAQLDASQEMLTLGLCNIAGSFFSAMPTCGAFTRSAVSQASGVRTPMAGIYTGILVLSALSILTPYFEYIPKSTLSAVLIAAVIFMVDFKPVPILWKSNKKDFFSWLGCFIVCLIFGVEMGLLYGITLNMIFVLLRLGNPRIEIALKEFDGISYLQVKPQSDIYFSGVDYLRTQIRSSCALYRYDFPLVLDCSRFMQFDATSVEMISAVAKELEEHKLVFVIQSLNEKHQESIPELKNVRFSNEKQLSPEDFQINLKKPTLT